MLAPSCFKAGILQDTKQTFLDFDVCKKMNKTRQMLEKTKDFILNVTRNF